MRIKLDPLDKLFSRFVRLRDKGICQRCGKYLGLTAGLHCSHYIKRRKQATRFDGDNCCALDFGCHQFFEENREEYTRFMIERLGQERFDFLTDRARKPVKIDRKLIELYLLQEMKQLEGGK